MGHHYLPQFYLRGFADGNTVWVHDRKDRRSFPSQPKAIANENRLYSEELEQHLANEVEEPANSAIKTLRDRQSLTSDQRIALAHYIVSLWKRVPGGRSRVYASVPDIAESVRQELHTQLDAATVLSPELELLAAARKSQVSEIIEKFKEDPPAELWHQNLARESSPGVVEALLSMQWRVLVSEKNEYLTSDNPVFFFQHEGIGRPSSELTLPLSSSVLIWASRQQSSGPFYLPASRPAIRALNRRVVFNSTRYVFSNRSEPWMLPFVCKTDHVLSRLSER
jgi:hypothetical protein